MRRQDQIPYYFYWHVIFAAFINQIRLMKVARARTSLNLETYPPHLENLKMTYDMTVQTNANSDTATQLALIEADVTFVLHPASIKGVMRDLNDGVKVAPSRDLWQLNPFALSVIPGLNPRVRTPKYLAHVRSLANSMKSEGFYQDKPLAGYVSEANGVRTLYIYEGATRLEAAKIAIQEGVDADVMFDKVPVSVCQDGMSMEDILVAMVRGNKAEPFTLYELAIMCKRMAKCGMSQSVIAHRLGIGTASQVKGLLSLMSAPYQLRELVATEAVAATYAIEVIAEYKEKALEVLLEGQSVAKSKGKSRVTKKYVPSAVFKQTVKKSAVPLYDTLVVVKSDPAFESLSAQTKEMLAKLLGEIEDKKKAAQAAAEAAVKAAEQATAENADNAASETTAA